MLDLLDAYELRARVFAAIVVTSPILVTALAFSTRFSASWTALAGYGVIALALIYLATFMVRQCGLSIEPALWKSWDGPPSTRFLRWRDNTLSAEVKELAHRAIAACCWLSLPSEAEEASDRMGADRRIAQVVGVMAATLRKRDAGGLWYSQVAEYGFARNLLGSRGIWALLSATGLAISALGMAFVTGSDAVLGVAFDGLSLVAAIFVGWRVLPDIAKASAERYAESAILAMIALYQADQRPSAQGQSKG